MLCTYEISFSITTKTYTFNQPKFNYYSVFTTCNAYLASITGCDQR